MMDRAEAIKLFEERLGATKQHKAFMESLNVGTKYEKAQIELYELVIAALREQESAENAHCNEWVSVEERLPKSDTRVLVWLPNSRSQYTRMDTDRLHFGKWVRWGMGVTHWMPLPEPPVGGDEE